MIRTVEKVKQGIREGQSRAGGLPVEPDVVTREQQARPTLMSSLRLMETKQG
ncbi:hypothetical protein EV356DRAFT_497665 [Viridothelium virens]|uniref:Uncharacterized protein n=1 Tax=Viridothelium virens TaxID=1048519 RepID=A0A6A6HH36_VIRVR|nr:hypothetical protein EV356DRAFT_497665 [Viridothelium virens]